MGYPISNRSGTKEADAREVIGLIEAEGRKPVALRVIAGGKAHRRKALVIGGDSGIGRAAAIASVREGADAAIAYLPDESLLSRGGLTVESRAHSAPTRARYRPETLSDYLLKPASKTDRPGC